MLARFKVRSVVLVFWPKGQGTNIWQEESVKCKVAREATGRVEGGISQRYTIPVGYGSARVPQTSRKGDIHEVE